MNLKDFNLSDCLGMKNTSAGLTWGCAHRGLLCLLYFSDLRGLGGASYSTIQDGSKG